MVGCRGIRSVDDEIWFCLSTHVLEFKEVAFVCKTSTVIFPIEQQQQSLVSFVFECEEFALPLSICYGFQEIVSVRANFFSMNSIWVFGHIAIQFCMPFYNDNSKMLKLEWINKKKPSRRSMIIAVDILLSSNYLSLSPFKIFTWKSVDGIIKSLFTGLMATHSPPFASRIHPTHRTTAALSRFCAEKKEEK